MTESADQFIQDIDRFAKAVDCIIMTQRAYVTEWDYNIVTAKQHISQL